MIVRCLVEATIRGFAVIEIDDKDYESATIDEIEDSYGDSLKEAINDYEIRDFELLQVDEVKTNEA